MKHGFYFRFKKIISNDFICAFLAQLAFFLYMIKYWYKKLSRKRVSVSMSCSEAHKLIDSCYTPAETEPQYINPPINQNVDLSIVVPVYNHKDILDECISTLINQKTQYNYEVILVDDGSTDGAENIVKKYESNPKVKAVYQKNAGIGAARNTGINNAVGEYLMFVDCDDTVHGDIVEKLMNKAYSGDFDMVMAAHNLVKEKNGQVIDVIPNIYSKYNLSGFKNADKIMNLAGLPWCKVYKRQMWNEVRFFPGYWYEDTIIQFLIFTQCRNYSYVPEVLYEYRWFEQNFSHIQGDKNNYKTIDSYGILLKIIKQYKKMNLLIDDAFYTLILRHISVYYYPMFVNFDEEHKSALFIVAKELLEKYKPNHKVKLPYMLRQVEKAFENDDVGLWEIASLYQ